MKTRKLNFLKIGILFFGITILLWNCEKEEISIDTIENFENIETELKKNTKIISLEDLQSKQKLNKTLQSLSRKFDINNTKSKSSNKKSKIVANDGSFTILTDNIRETSTDSTRTYSFLLEKPTLSTSAFENFVIERQKDSTYNFYIYHFEANFSQKDFPFTITTSLLDNDLIVNTNFVSLFSKGCGGGGYTMVSVYGWHCDCCGGRCNNHNPQWGHIGLESVWVWNSGCGEKTYSNTSDDNWGTGNYTGTRSTGGTNLHDPSSPVAVIPPTMSQLLSGLITLTTQEENCLNKPSNIEQVEDLMSYLLTNDTTDNQQQAQIFGQSAIDAICNGGGVDYENEIILECPKRDMVKDSSGKCVKKCETTKEDLKEVFPNTSSNILQDIADAINTHGKDFGIDTDEKLQHFISQAAHEATNPVNGIEFDTFEENLNYRWARLGTKDYWENHFNPIANPTADPYKKNPNDYKRNGTSNYVNVTKFANYVYDDAYRKPKFRIGNTNIGDGYKYRGRGIFQLTGRTNYQQFNTFYRERYNSSINFINNPDLLATDTEIAVISALWYYDNKVNSNSITSTTTVEKVTKKINGGKKGLKHREQLFNKTKNHINCN